jgi:hypothetical protein
MLMRPIVVTFTSGTEPPASSRHLVAEKIASSSPALAASRALDLPVPENLPA